jgi:amidase
VIRLSKEHRVFAFSGRAVPALLTDRLGLTLEVATMLMNAGGELQVSQIVDPLRTARCALPKACFAGLGADLV